MPNIKIESTDKALSSYGGLFLFNKVFNGSKFETVVGRALPRLKSGTQKSFNKFKHLVMAFGAGAHCLDDIIPLSLDDGFSAVCGDDVYSPKSYGDFLRSFSSLQAKEINQSMAANAYHLRSEFVSKQKSITIDLDSTPNVQHGTKMEGAAYNYKNEWCLDTLHAFDEFGLQYWCDVRPGNTYSSNGAVEAIHHIFKQVPQGGHYKGVRRYLRGDSAFSNVDVFNACAAKNVGFVCCLKRNMAGPLLGNIRNWKPAKNKKNKRKQIRFHDERQCELGETIYRPENSANILRVVVMRALKKGNENLLLKQIDDYDYYSFVTSIGEHELSTEKLILFYRQRGQAENYIKEMKYNYDLLHYPCLKLTANKVWGVIAGFAHNLMRAFALAKNESSPCYAKKVRIRLIYLPCQVVRHAGEIIFRFMGKHFEEVKHWREYINQVQYGFS